MLRKFRVTIDGRPYEVTCEEITEGGRTIPQPGDMRVPAPNPPPGPPPAAGAAAPPAASSGEETSPLAGLIESISVAVGDQVEVGQPIAVLEAMKMKTTVVAGRGGRVAEIRVKIGESVDAGQPLMRIE